MPRRTPEIAAWFNREAEILSIAAGRSVLHLGCVGNPDATPAERGGAYSSSLHRRLSRVATTVGVDTSVEVVQLWRERQGVQNVVVGDVEELQDLALEKTFDVIVAGDIIEHVSNPGRLLDGVHALCGPDTAVIITTPNSFGLANYLRYLRGEFADGDEHVVSFNPATLVSLLERHHFTVETVATCHQEAAAHSALFPLGARLLKRFPKLGGTLFAVARPADRRVAGPTADDSSAPSRVE